MGRASTEPRREKEEGEEGEEDEHEHGGFGNLFPPGLVAVVGSAGRGATDRLPG